MFCATLHMQCAAWKCVCDHRSFLAPWRTTGEDFFTDFTFGVLARVVDNVFINGAGPCERGHNLRQNVSNMRFWDLCISEMCRSWTKQTATNLLQLSLSFHWDTTATKSKILTNFFIGTSYSNGLIFTCGEKKGWSLIWLWKKLIFFRLCAQQRREKNHIERDHEKWCHKSHDIRNTDFLPIWTPTSRLCTGPRRDNSGENDRLPTFCAASSWFAIESIGHAINP